MQIGESGARVKRCAVQDVLGCERRDAGEGGREGTVQRKAALRSECGGKCFFRERERIGFLQFLGDKVGAARQHFAERTHTRGDAAHAVQNHIVFIGKDDVRILAHELHIEGARRDVSEFIELRCLNADNALQPQLFDRGDLAGADVFPE